MSDQQIDEFLARRLIVEQFPEWADLPISSVAQQGVDNRTFRLGETLSIRLPSHTRYVAGVDKENRWLPRLAPQLPLPIPTPVATGRPTADFPRPWSVRRWLDGITLTDARGVDQLRLARDLAGFLRALHQADAAGGPPAGEHNFHRGAPLAVYDEQTRRAIAALGTSIDAHALIRMWDVAVESVWQGAPVWLHGDVAPGNLLLNPRGELSAVIDFGTAGVGDPACDLVIAWTVLDRGPRRAFCSLMEPDAAMWARARGWALWKAVITLADGRDPAAVHQSSTVVRELSAEAGGDLPMAF
ncbi:aminoglycoside phosphotransferase family protein [Pseudonocardia endophytica]|uniref:Aminoglycoside phosphotransferase (APT) family kinase protein n=1 Tax=Pseudonocardia endophytica TaxID=401976 RepID=A0A4R1HI79_PSEEN|nr:aminoglycoside phosphotransferase family protein [Pseudonocardia endophytica]TCK20553.1 aminoglycoside phosphotransferase (APT) family kinase protein [Pseudonocardia endophytica]